MKTIKQYEIRTRRVQLGEQSATYRQKIGEPWQVVRLAQDLIGDAGQEVFLAFYLNVRNRVLGFTEVARGGIDTCPVDPRVVFRSAIATGASALIVAHNHPSDDADPSAEDLALTNRLKKGCGLLGLSLLDHVIVTPSGGYTSLAERRQL